MTDGNPVQSAKSHNYQSTHPIRSSLSNQSGNQPSSQAAWQSNYQGSKQATKQQVHKQDFNLFRSTRVGGQTATWQTRVTGASRVFHANRGIITNSHQSSIYSRLWYVFTSSQRCKVLKLAEEACNEGVNVDHLKTPEFATNIATNGDLRYPFSSSHAEVQQYTATQTKLTPKKVGTSTGQADIHSWRSWREFSRCQTFLR